MKKRFPDWKPQAGEKALVPGGPANRRFVDELRHDDVEAIERGHNRACGCGITKKWAKQNDYAKNE